MNSLIKKDVNIYLEGGWKFEGIVLQEDQNRIVIKKTKDLIIIMKDKISALELVSKRETTKDSKVPKSILPEGVGRVEEDSIYSKSNMSFPSGLIAPGLKEKGVGEDLSISFSNNFSGENKKGGIEFRMKDDE